MPRIPFTETDLSEYGAWLGPDGEYYIVHNLHEHIITAIKLGLVKGFLKKEDYVNLAIAMQAGDIETIWNDPLGEKAYSAMFDNGYVRIVFSKTRIDFEAITELPPLISEAMKSLPTLPILFENHSGYAFRKYTNLGDYKAKNGLGATVTEHIRSGLETTDMQNPNEEVYASWVRKFCRFAQESKNE